MTTESKSIDAMTHCLFATENALEAIQEAGIARRETALEIRDIRLMCHENVGKLKEMLAELEEQVERERIGNTKWMDRRMDHAKAMADEALNSTLMVKDVQTLEKKVSILKESIIQVNKSYKEYADVLDMSDLQAQVIDMVHRIERMEKEALKGYPTDEKSLERAFRGAMEGLYGLKTKDPKLQAYANKLAAEMAVFRDAAANGNFYAMVSSKTAIKKSSESVSASSSESKISSTAATASTGTTSTFSPYSDHDSEVSPSEYSSGSSMPKKRMPKKK